MLATSKQSQDTYRSVVTALQLHYFLRFFCIGDVHCGNVAWIQREDLHVLWLVQLVLAPAVEASDLVDLQPVLRDLSFDVHLHGLDVARCRKVA